MVIPLLANQDLTPMFTGVVKGRRNKSHSNDPIYEEIIKKSKSGVRNLQPLYFALRNATRDEENKFD